MHYTVQNGDTLWLVGQKFKQNYRAIAMANAIEPPYLVYPGQVLHIPRSHRLIGFIPDYASSEGIADALKAPEPFNEVVYTFMRVQPDGSVQVGPVDSRIQVLRTRMTRVLVGLSNQSEAAYSRKAADSALLEGDSRSRLAASAVSVAVSNAFDGVHLDFQEIEAAHWDGAAELLCEIRARFSQLSPYYTTSVSIPSNWCEKPFDLKRTAECTDLMIMEGYEKGASHSEGPLAPLPWLKQTVSSAIAEVGPARLVVTLGIYGLDWSPKGDTAYITSEAAQQTATETSAQIDRDQTSGTPRFHYEDASGVTHQVWYEDLDSLSMKMQLLESLGVRKIAIWRLGSVPMEIIHAVCEARTWA
ncbi:MAG: glycosyl hydrolase family 18 protein [Clostridia bacterium]|nr:glycosyl hydrolase family 18 protein [Clostridia bacterium]